jgi:hypothetical protein
MTVSLATWEADIGRITVQGQPSISIHKKLGMVVCACHFNNMGSTNRRIIDQARLDINVRPYVKSN